MDDLYVDFYGRKYTVTPGKPGFLIRRPVDGGPQDIVSEAWFRKYMRPAGSA